MLKVGLQFTKKINSKAKQKINSEIYACYNILTFDVSPWLIDKTSNIFLLPAPKNDLEKYIGLTAHVI